jgi:nitrate reductase delta subunit
VSRLLGHRHAGPPPEQLTLVWQSASLLLGYPDRRLLELLPVVEAAAARLPASFGDPLREVAAHLAATPLERLQADYVATFDTRRRCNLFLTYFLHGDTRKRGMALLRFKQTYLRGGFQLAESGEDAELPDHLCVVLEFGATVDHELGRRLLIDHRAGLELLRLALRDCGSPWAPAVEVVTSTLPRLRGDEYEVVRRLAAEGPPEEEVGLSPYDGAHPLIAQPMTEPLPMPTLRGGR